jgi:hypothetical protein
MEIDPRPVFLFFWGELSHCGGKKKKEKKTPVQIVEIFLLGEKKERKNCHISSFPPVDDCQSP